LTHKIPTIAQLHVALGGELHGDGTLEIRDVTHDSRNAGPGVLFAAIAGGTVDGHRFVPDVIRRGSPAILSERPPTASSPAWITVPEVRTALAKAASMVHGEPSRELDLVGITGTNGKTTTTYLCYAIARAAGARPAMLTTVEYRIGDQSQPAVRTTPEASDTNRFLRTAVDEGCRAAVMESSSQAIDLHRCDWLRYKVAVFTNLTRDHLDYHGTMEAYFDSKKKLFDGRLGEPPPSSIINIDDEWGRRLNDELRSNGQRTVTFSTKQPADLTASEVVVSMVRGTSFQLDWNDGSVNIASPLVGLPHVYNMLSAAGVAFELGFGVDAVVKGLAECTGAPGRFERVPHDGDFAVVVDYAHTDDALLNTLRTARDLANGRVITVFGCGGDRDRTKRPVMGRVAGKCSDLVFVTSDNPRTEDPLSIIKEIEEGLRETETPYSVSVDRRTAIRSAVQAAAPGDVIVIAGKGHETYQIIGNDRFHFDDREVAAHAIKARDT
jgi:UDP-N-acetylmuramoyl-L-alanyl-D-glutamate--2,6-diaminopimelate ligase